MVKRRHKLNQRIYKRRRRVTLMLLLVIILLFGGGPFIQHIRGLQQARNVYDVSKVNEELQWLKKHGGIINKLALIQDSNLWLDLNLEKGDLTSELATYQDEKHLFWLFLFHLHNGNLSEAQKVIEMLGSNIPAGQLGQGLISLANGDGQECQYLLSKTDADWNALTDHEQTLRHLGLAQAKIILGDHAVALSEIQEAEQLEPQNPACLSLTLNVAIKEGDWSKAKEISKTMDLQTWRPKDTLYEVRRALLAIHEQDKQTLANALSELKSLSHGEATISYLNGIQALSNGQLSEGKELLESAIKKGLNLELEVDAQKALKQITERQGADKALKAAAAKV